MSEDTQEKLSLKELDGISGLTIKKLHSIGIETIKDLAASDSHRVAKESNVGLDTAQNYIKKAKVILRETGTIPKLYMRSDELLERRKKLLRCSTGSKQLDSLFDDRQGNIGIETQAITEFYGEFGSGKSQICHTLAVLAQQSHENGGFGGSVFMIDTEGTYRPERVQQIALAREIDAADILHNVIDSHATDSDELEDIINDLGTPIREYNTKLVIVDSISSLHRAEFAGRGTLADRQQSLNKMMHKLIRIAEIFDIAVVVTNQVLASPGTMFGDPTIAVGGHIMGHTSTYRIYLRKGAQHSRIARMIDSPSHAYGECRFTVNEKGVVDVEDDKK